MIPTKSQILKLVAVPVLSFLLVLAGTVLYLIGSRSQPAPSHLGLAAERCPGYGEPRDEGLEAAYQAGWNRASTFYYGSKNSRQELVNCMESLMEYRHPDGGAL